MQSRQKNNKQQIAFGIYCLYLNCDLSTRIRVKILLMKFCRLYPVEKLIELAAAAIIGTVGFSEGPATDFGISTEIKAYPHLDPMRR